MKIIKLSKLDIAKEQLERALSLFFNEEDYLSSITLSGAADEILGKLRESLGESSEYTELKGLFEFMKEEAFVGNEYNLLANGTRNGLKHYQEGVYMEFCPEQEAINILDRAVSNYVSITGKETKLIKRFRNHTKRAAYNLNIP